MNFELEERERAEFLELVRQVNSPAGALAGFFSPELPVGVARAPGRLDVMGGIADYSGSLVLEMPIAEAACAAAQLHPERELRVASVDLDSPHRVRQARMPIEPLLGASYAEASRLLSADGLGDFVPYIGGVLMPLLREGKRALDGGVRIALSSRVPAGKGVSSSAAIEVAAFFALAAAAGFSCDARDAALHCQRVENLVVGAPCGVMDQMTSACGRRGQLLELLCQPATLQGSRAIPDGLRFFGIDSGVRHAVRGADYGQVRVAAFMGYRIIAERCGLRVAAGEASGQVQIEDELFGGYLSNVSPSVFDERFRSELPEKLSGRDFLQRFGGISDRVTRIDPNVEYPVRSATEHPIREHHRVRCFAELLAAPPSERSYQLLGELMLQSHQSYSACGLGSAATDRLVELVNAVGTARGLYGAKITGGGSGGTVVVLARAGAEAEVEAVASRFSQETGHQAHIFRGSSAGAADFGALLVPGATLAPPT